MANNLSLTASSGNLGIFECPACKQTIDASAEKCRYCSATIDPVAAGAAAEKMSKINQACSDASFLRTAAISVLAFIGIMFIPFFGLLGIVGYYFLLVAVPFLTIRWWVKFGRIKADDSDFRRARITVIVISALIVIPIALSIAQHL
ncbi:MAG: hypothetical protein ABR957_04380 [Terracidiphilus sp.]|jgi:hypothetical protein